MTASVLERLPTFTLAAMAIGFLVSLALGGRFRHLSGKSFRIWLLLPIGLLLQLLVQRDGAPAPFALLLLSYACLIGFGIANWRLTGMWLIVLGLQPQPPLHRGEPRDAREPHRHRVARHRRSRRSV